MIFLTTIGSSNDKPSFNHFFVIILKGHVSFWKKRGDWSDFLTEWIIVIIHLKYTLFTLIFRIFWWVQYWFGEMKEYVAYH